MSKVKILIVEDEIVIAENIRAVLDKLGYEVLEPAIHYTEALETLERDKPDLAILDIQLGGAKDGIDLAWKIKEDYDLPFIFLTSNADPRTVERAKKLSPPAYLVKPFNRDDLYTSIEIALYNFKGIKKEANEEEQEQVFIKDSIFIKSKNLFHKVKFGDIQFIKSDLMYLQIHTTGKKSHLIRATMNRFCKTLPKNFFRVHRSYTVNLDHLEAINSASILIGKEEIPIGKNYRDELMKMVRIE